MENCRSCSERGADQCAAVWNFEADVVASLRGGAEIAHRAGALHITIAHFLCALCRGEATSQTLGHVGMDPRALEDALAQLATPARPRSSQSRLALSQSLNALLVASEQTALHAGHAVVTLDMVRATLMQNAAHDEAAAIFHRFVSGVHQQRHMTSPRPVHEANSWPVSAAGPSPAGRSQQVTARMNSGAGRDAQPSVQTRESVRSGHRDEQSYAYRDQHARSGQYRTLGALGSSEQRALRQDADPLPRLVSRDAQPRHSTSADVQRAPRVTSDVAKSRVPQQGQRQDHASQRAPTESEHYETILRMLRVQEARLERLEAENKTLRGRSSGSSHASDHSNSRASSGLRSGSSAVSGSRSRSSGSGQSNGHGSGRGLHQDGDRGRDRDGNRDSKRSRTRDGEHDRLSDRDRDHDREGADRSRADRNRDERGSWASRERDQREWTPCERADRDRTDRDWADREWSGARQDRSDQRASGHSSSSERTTRSTRSTRTTSETRSKNFGRNAQSRSQTQNRPDFRIEARRESRSDAAAEQANGKKDKRFYLSLDDDLVDAPSIGPKTAARFTPLGIHTVRDLLELDADEVAAQLKVRHISAEVLRDLQDQARLVCTVPWLRGTHAQLLVGADYRQAKDLAAADLGEVLASILRFAATNQGERILRTNPPPERDKVATWLGFAKQADVSRVA